MNNEYLINVNNYKKNIDYPSKLIRNCSEEMKPLITIAIPTYKRSELLSDAIMSAINQNEHLCNYEILVVDNEFDKNDTLKYISKIKAMNISYYKNTKNIGMFGNWNRCVELARGDWIAFLHDDDLLFPNYLQTIERLIVRKNNIGCIASRFVSYKQKDFSDKFKINKIKKYKYYNYFRDKLIQFYSIDSELFNYNVYNAATCGTIFKKKYLLSIGGFNEKLYPSSDWFLMYNFNRNYKVYKTIIPLGAYRIYSNESNKIDIIKAFIRQSYEFNRYVSQKNILFKKYVSFFKYEQYYLSIKPYMSQIKKLGYSPEYFNSIEAYKIRHIRLFIYSCVRKLYFKSKTVLALLFG